MESEAQQPAFVVARVQRHHDAGNVDERSGQLIAVLIHDPDLSNLVEDEQPPGVVRRFGGAEGETRLSAMS